ncbi:sugar transferase [Fictibacillus sp. Sa2CUA10]|uniref:Sugar transferase n=1 Tax=Fictibacillus norfolkensis TaxID=2762233 RepID=A0ABR8SI93_9BACL|nr:sugar transferase [Fictibacillus norfolkensis]
MSNLAEREYIHLHTGVTINAEQQRSYLLVKRIIDISGSLFGLFLLGIIFVVVAIAIKLEDPKGPIIFTQKRVGKNGKEFKMYKFRSMISDAENRLEDLLKFNETTGAMFKMKDDPRITNIGRLIRKTSIDELPQLWNVLLGDMSLVGPRPPLLREVKEYTKYDLQRLLVVPGCTGLWQVNGRSDIGFNEMVELDLQYIRTRNLKLDFRIILKTIKVMIKPEKGAY